MDQVDESPLESSPRKSRTPDARQRRFVGLRLVFGLLAISIVLGVFVFWRLVDSERHLARTWHQMHERGEALSAEGCVDEVLAWSDDCEAMKGLCDLSVTGMMVSCLSGQDRTEYCESLGDAPHSTHFGYQECAARHLDREGRTVCAATYRAIDGHCRQLARRDLM